MSFLDYTAIGAYAIVIVLIGLRFSSKKDDRDFYLAGQKMPWWAVGISIFGTQLSAITFMAIPAKTFASDWSYIVGQFGILLCVPLIVGFYIPALRRAGVSTVYEYLETRFNLTLRLIGAALFTLLQLGRMGIVIFLPALAVSTATGLDIYLAILLTGFLTTIYSVTGGMEAVIWTDVVQVVVLLGAAVIAFSMAISGSGAPAETLWSTAGDAGKLKIDGWSLDLMSASVLAIFVGQAFSQLTSYSADQTVVQRYLTTPDEKAAGRSVWLNALMSIPSSLIFFGLGTALFLFYAFNPVRLEGLPSDDSVVPWFVVHELPAGITGLVIAGLFSAAMSTLDSSINSVSAVLVNDFYRRVINPAAGSLLGLARLLTFSLGLLATGAALLLAGFDIKSLFDVFLETIGLAGGTLGGLVAIAVLTRSISARSALLGVVASLIVVTSAKIFGFVHFLLYGALGFLVCIGSAVAIECASRWFRVERKL